MSSNKLKCPGRRIVLMVMTPLLQNNATVAMGRLCMIKNTVMSERLEEEIGRINEAFFSREISLDGLLAKKT